MIAFVTVEVSMRSMNGSKRAVNRRCFSGAVFEFSVAQVHPMVGLLQKVWNYQIFSTRVCVPHFNNTVIIKYNKKLIIIDNERLCKK